MEKDIPGERRRGSGEAARSKDLGQFLYATRKESFRAEHRQAPLKSSIAVALTVRGDLFRAASNDAVPLKL
jgi:hypothetical protein